MKTNKYFLIILILTICTSCNSQAPIRTGNQSLRVGVLPIADCLQIFVAQEQGFFKANGLEVELITMSGGSVIATSVEAGELEIGWSNILSIALADAQGFDYSFFAPGAVETGTNRPHKLMVAVNSTINNVIELEGKTVAVNTFANVPYIAVNELISKNGLNPTTVRFVEVPFPDMPSLLASGEIDAALMSEPFVSTSISKNQARILVADPFSSLGDRILVAAWFSKREWLNEHEVEASAFINAILSANDFITKNEDESRAILLKYTNLDPNLVQLIVLPEYASDIKKNEMFPVFSAAESLGLLKTTEFPDIIYLP